MRGARAVVWLTAAALLMGAAAPTDLRGPLSDFWTKVKRDWSHRLPGLNHGPLQTAVWVAMIWDGPEDVALGEIAVQLQEREARRWVRSQITRHRFSAISRRDLSRMQAFRQNIILLGTPHDNPLVGRALQATPLRVGRGWISMGRRRVTGSGLLLIAIAPNPIHPERYALVISGSSAGALTQAGQVPYGETDYVVYRGRKVIERGFFDWADGAPRGTTVAVSQAYSDHFGWDARESAHFRLHFDPAAASVDAVVRFGRRIDAEMERAAAFYGAAGRGFEPIDLFLYESIDEKESQTADQRPAHFDPSDGSLHVVASAAAGGLDAWDIALAARVLLKRDAAWAGNRERELPGLELALSLACSDHFQTIPLARWAARSSRDSGYLPMDVLFSRRPGDLESGDVTPLDAAAFVRDLILREGAGRVAAFYRSARRSDFRRRFRETFGLSIAQAEARWLQSIAIPRDVASSGADQAAPDPGQDLGPALAAVRRRDDHEAERLLRRLDPAAVPVLTLLARLRFRAGRFEEASVLADEALNAVAGSAEDRAWARLTLGRARAMRGLLVAAGADLRAEEIRRGPEPIRVIAALWLERLGQSLDQRAANDALMRQAGADLMNFDWEAAERGLQVVLASDPQNREAHAMLGQVYLSKYQYWHDVMLLDLELFPGESQADPEIYRFLADKGRSELRLAESLPWGEPEHWVSDAGAVEPGVDQPMSHLLIGKALLIRGELASARRELQTALALKPSDANLIACCHLYLGRIAAAMGRRTEAREAYTLALKVAEAAAIRKLAKEELGKLGP